MVMKSFFARLFGRADDNGAANKRARADRSDRSSRRETESRRLDTARLEDPSEPTAGDTNGANGNDVDEIALASDVPETAFVAPITPKAPPTPLETPAPASGPPVPSKPMTKEEELALKLTQGFQGISSVLTGIDRKLDEQHKHSSELMTTVQRIPELVKDVPESQRLGLELLASISRALDEQNRSTQDLATRVGELPAALTKLEQHVAEQTQAAAETERLAREAREQLGSALTDVKGSVNELESRSAQRQEALLAEMKERQAAHDRQVTDLIERSARSSRMLVFLLIVVIVTLLLVVRTVAA